MVTNKLQIADYCVFSIMLFISAMIGVFYACTGGKQRTTTEFLMANHQMGVLPVALSLLASFMSAITLLGTPSEMYQNGTQYWLIGGSYVIVVFVAAHVLLPVFYKLELTSAYEYLELRFNKLVRVQGCVTFLVQMIMYMGIVLYAPALALSAVTGLSWIFSVLVLGIVCTFYTTIGGMKAVMWTDVFQITIMFSGMIAVVVVGTVKVGSWSLVWEALERGQRVEFLNFDPNPFVRHTVWSLVLGGACTWLVIYGVNQSQVQRYLTTPTMRKAQIALWLNLPGLFLLLTICALAGIVAYAYYEHCDPLTVKRIAKGDQILPLFVMDVLNYPGFPGLFIATIFSGALSTVSSGLNALAAVTLEDIIKPYCLCCGVWRFKEFTEHHGAIAAKILAFSFGVVALGLAFVASQMGDVLQAALGLFGMVGGPLLGIFLLGVLFPCANWQGAFVGHLFGEIMSLWVGFGSYIYKYKSCKLPYLTDQCPNGTVTPAPSPPQVCQEDLDYQGLTLYRMSYMWQGAWAIFCTVLMGLLVSLITKKWNKQEVDPRLICPIFDEFCCCLPEKVRKFLRCGLVYKAGRDAPIASSGSPMKAHISATESSRRVYPRNSYGHSEVEMGNSYPKPVELSFYRKNDNPKARYTTAL